MARSQKTNPAIKLRDRDACKEGKKEENDDDDCTHNDSSPLKYFSVATSMCCLCHGRYATIQMYTNVLCYKSDQPIIKIHQNISGWWFQPP